MAESSGSLTRRFAGDRAKRIAIWVLLLGLPLAYEASDLLAGPRAYYGGDRTRWFAGLDVRLILTALGLGVLLWALRAAGEGLTSIGWPRRIPVWQAIVLVLVLAGGVAAVFYHPPTVSPVAAKVAASTPFTLLERAWVLVMAAAEALVQELVWRGALITWLEPRLGSGGAALLSAASFIFFHPAFGLTWQGLRVALPITAAYTFLFLWRRSIGPSAFLHFLLTAGQLLSPV